MPSDEKPVVASNEGSLVEGFGWAWGVLVLSVVLAVALGAGLEQALADHHSWALFAGLLPPLSLLGLLVGCYFSGRRRMALGVLAAFGTMFALVLLLVAACFGMFGLSG